MSKNSRSSHRRLSEDETQFCLLCTTNLLNRKIELVQKLRDQTMEHNVNDTIRLNPQYMYLAQQCKALGIRNSKIRQCGKTKTTTADKVPPASFYNRNHFIILHEMSLKHPELLITLNAMMPFPSNMSLLETLPTINVQTTSKRTRPPELQESKNQKHKKMKFESNNTLFHQHNYSFIEDKSNYCQSCAERIANKQHIPMNRCKICLRFRCLFCMEESECWLCQSVDNVDLEIKPVKYVKDYIFPQHYAFFKDCNGTVYRRLFEKLTKYEIILRTQQQQQKHDFYTLSQKTIPQKFYWSSKLNVTVTSYTLNGNGKQLDLYKVKGLYDKDPSIMQMFHDQWIEPVLTSNQIKKSLSKESDSEPYMNIFEKYKIPAINIINTYRAAALPVRTFISYPFTWKVVNNKKTIIKTNTTFKQCISEEHKPAWYEVNQRMDALIKSLMMYDLLSDGFDILRDSFWGPNFKHLTCNVNMYNKGAGLLAHRDLEQFSRICIPIYHLYSEHRKQDINKADKKYFALSAFMSSPLYCGLMVDTCPGDVLLLGPNTHRDWHHSVPNVQLKSCVTFQTRRTVS